MASRNQSQGGDMIFPPYSSPAQTAEATKHFPTRGEWGGLLRPRGPAPFTLTFTWAQRLSNLVDIIRNARDHKAAATFNDLSFLTTPVLPSNQKHYTLVVIQQHLPRAILASL